ncbi:MAG TPA: hypothetical protein VGH28_20960 [Polyangiaceae bacterium]|jgi:hypothetical protein
MKHVVLLGLGGLVSSVVFACSSAPPPDPGQQPPSQTTDCSAADQNGYGICYPTADVGTKSRTGFGASGVEGNRIANYGFTGYPASDVTQVTPGTTATIHLSQYYDPQQKGIPGIIGGVPIKIIHLTVAARWCEPCNMETDFIAGQNFTGQNTGGASFASELAPLGVVFVQALDDGTTVGTGATVSDLNAWIGDHKNDFSTGLDPGNAQLGVFFDAAAIPFNMNIDARSMEILSADVGFDTGMDQTIKSGALAWVGKNPAKQ